MNPILLDFLFFIFLPGFAITFLIGWRSSRSKPNFLTITVRATLIGIGFAVIICGGLDAAFFYLMSPRVVDHYTSALTVDQARQQDCPIPLPDSARKVQFVVASGGLQALEILVRFEAPVDVCKSHVQTVFEANARKMGFPLHALPLVPLDHTPSPEAGDMVGQAPWFDIDKIEHGIKAGNGTASFEPQFWIDADRGVFYCKITD